MPARQPLDPWVPQTPVWSWSHLHFGENEADVRAHGLSRSRPRCTAPNVSQDAPHCGLLCWNIRRHRKARPRRRGKSARPSSGSWSRCWEVSRAQGRPAQPGSVIYLRFRVNDGAARLGAGGGGTRVCSKSRLWSRVEDWGGRQAASRQLCGPQQGSRPTPLQFVEEACGLAGVCHCSSILSALTGADAPVLP